jgi:hypothetical protein
MRASSIAVRIVMSPRLAHAFVDVAGGVADLEAEIPQHVEHVLDDLSPQASACRAAGRADRCRSPAPACRARSRRLPPPPCARLVEDADQLVHVVGEPGRAGRAAAILHQEDLGAPVALRQFLLEALQGVGPQRVRRGGVSGQYADSSPRSASASIISSSLSGILAMSCRCTMSARSIARFAGAAYGRVRGRMRARQRAMACVCFPPPAP